MILEVAAVILVVLVQEINMFNEDAVNAFYAGKEDGYEEKQYSNPHEEMVDFLAKNGVTVAVSNKLHDQYKRGYEWGKAQKDEEKS